MLVGSEEYAVIDHGRRKAALATAVRGMPKPHPHVGTEEQECFQGQKQDECGQANGEPNTSRPRVSGAIEPGLVIPAARRPAAAG
jgi:hypothetical protein